MKISLAVFKLATRGQSDGHTGNMPKRMDKSLQNFVPNTPKRNASSDFRHTEYENVNSN
jgi:hypothetical protein